MQARYCPSCKRTQLDFCPCSHLLQIFLNGTPPPLKQAYFVQPGDMVSPSPRALPGYRRHIASEMGTLLNDVHRDFLA